MFTVGPRMMDGNPREVFVGLDVAAKKSVTVFSEIEFLTQNHFTG